MSNKDTYCSFCGTVFNEDQISYPKTCSSCNNTTIKNLQLNVLAIVPILDKGKIGLLLCKKSTNPEGWEIPGGSMYFGETWEQSVTRELNEQTCINLPENMFNLLRAITPSENLTLVCQSTWLDITDSPLPEFVPNDNVLEVKVAFEPEELASSTHTELLAERLVQLNSAGPYIF